MKDKSKIDVRLRQATYHLDRIQRGKEEALSVPSYV